MPPFSVFLLSVLLRTHIGQGLAVVEGGRSEDKGTPRRHTSDCVPGDTPRCCFMGRCLNFLIQETQALLGEGRDQFVGCWGGWEQTVAAATKAKVSLPKCAYPSLPGGCGTAGLLGRHSVTCAIKGSSGQQQKAVMFPLPQSLFLEEVIL